ncbi:hypothetical protein ULMS_18130 [Patiriisocius marinistellae]|uniref:Uncharacterized protein n=1 Tax=Patiriisocius marinistellae TaxID=2494560 RepID=A0A5J4G1I8_9FLAO|nr:hypothetical protein [Patiriisocius marinistellae]GEQ86305.1 hypothetical protein ULMS_18130 [Patiriisocius marinistellae]
MKVIVQLLFFTLAFTTFSQSNTKICDYKINMETEEEIFKLTQESLAEFMVGNGQTVFMYFSLMKQGNIKSFVLHTSLNAVEMPPIICYNDKSRVTFQLESGEFVSAPYLGEETCGRQSKGEESLNNMTSEGSFYLDDVSIKRLSNSPLNTMRITTMNTNFDVNFKKVISNEQIAKPIYPREFFVENLSCIE